MSPSVAEPKLDEKLVEAYRKVLYDQGIEIMEQLRNLANDFEHLGKDTLLDNKMEILLTALYKFERQILALGVKKDNSLDNRITILMSQGNHQGWIDTTIRNKLEARIKEDSKDEEKRNNELKQALSVTPEANGQEVEERKKTLLNLNKKFLGAVFNPEDEKTLGKNRSWITLIVKTLLTIGTAGIANGLAAIYARLFKTTGLYGTASEKMLLKVKSTAEKGLKANKQR